MIEASSLAIKRLVVHHQLIQHFVITKELPRPRKDAAVNWEAKLLTLRAVYQDL
jgi:hypothetical protein